MDYLPHGRLGPPEELLDLRTNTARSTGAGVSSTTSSAVETASAGSAPSATSDALSNSSGSQGPM
ncbi:hypothetical protein TN53_41440 [Streptomyces sp. WM6386]|nr:hypothetical protein TN53_41440 [Streptomyces sp. WM6386]